MCLFYIQNTNRTHIPIQSQFNRNEFLSSALKASAFIQYKTVSWVHEKRMRRMRGGAPRYYFNIIMCVCMDHTNQPLAVNKMKFATTRTMSCALSLLFAKKVIGLCVPPCRRRISHTHTHTKRGTFRAISFKYIHIY